MKFLAIGDLHIASKRMYLLPKIDKYCVDNGIDSVIQVGDFGISWPGENCSILRYFNKRATQKRPGPTWISCLGNHDNWNKFDRALKKEAEFTGIPREDIPVVSYAPGLLVANRPGFLDIFGGVLFCGGAVSTDADFIPRSGWGYSGEDHPGRVENKDWWRQEAPTRDQLQKFCDLIDERKPKYIITHDGPEFAHDARGSGTCLKSNLRWDYCSRAFETISQITEHKPKRWFFGHHHDLEQTEKGKTTYHCCGLHGEGWLIDDNTNSCSTINLGI